MTGLAE
jgi:hypothetical protein